MAYVAVEYAEQPGGFATTRNFDYVDFEGTTMRCYRDGRMVERIDVRQVGSVQPYESSDHGGMF